MNNFDNNKYDLSLLNSFNENILSEVEDNNNIIPFLLDESEIPIIKQYQKNIFTTKKATIKEKIKHQKLLLEQKRGLIEKEKKEIYFDKKEDLKRRNREAAQKSRDKKKLELKKIIEENKQLKDEIYLINSKIHLLCSGCKSIFELKIEDTKNNNNICLNCSSIKDNNNNIDINDIPSTNYSFSNLKIQKLFNFTLLGLFTLLCIFALYSLNSSNSNNISLDIEDINQQKIRNMKEIEQNININNNIKINNNNISRLKDYFIKYHNNNNNDLDSNIDNFNKYKNNNNHHHNYKNEVCEKDYFTSFQCQKKSFIHNINTYDNESINNNDDNYYFNNTFIDNNENTINKNKNSIYFKLFVQSCSKDEGDINNDTINENTHYDHTHYIFSSDNNMCQDFYYFCQRIEN